MFKSVPNIRNYSYLHVLIFFAYYNHANLMVTWIQHFGSCQSTVKLYTNYDGYRHLFGVLSRRWVCSNGKCASAVVTRLTFTVILKTLHIPTDIYFDIMIVT